VITSTNHAGPVDRRITNYSEKKTNMDCFISGTDVVCYILDRFT